MKTKLIYPKFDKDKHVIQCPLVLQVERKQNGGLTNKELEEKNKVKEDECKKNN